MHDRDRVARRCRTGHQRRWSCEHTPQHVDRLSQMVAGMPVAGQPPQVRGHQRIHRTEQPILHPASAQARAVASNFATSRGLRRSTGRPVDHHRRAIASAGEEVRRVRVRLARGIDPVQPKRLGRDADHGQVEVQIQQVIAFQPRLKPHMAAGSG